MSLTTKSFFEEFPEYSNSVMFVENVADLKNVSAFLDNQESDKCDSIKKFLHSHTERDYCVPFYLGQDQFFIVNLTDDFDWVSLIDWPLFKSDIKNEFKEYICQHEIGHIIHMLLEPEGDNHDNWVLINKEGFDKKHLGEEVADCYAALQLLNEHGQEALPLIRRISDIRILFAVKHGNTTHCTNNILDKIIEKFSDAEAIRALQELSAQALAKEALAFAKKYSLHPIDKQFQIDEWWEAIFKPTPENWLKPENKVVFDAANRQLVVSIDKVDEFIWEYDFDKGDLSEVFKQSVFMKIVAGINVSLVDHEDMSVVQELIEEGMLNRDSNIGGGNRYPKLQRYIKTARGTFLGDRFAMVSAMSAPDLKNDMAARYLGREAILRMAEFPQPPPITLKS